MLQARDLVRSVGDRTLLKRVHADVHAGQQIALTGATGSGKSLLLRTLAMLEPLDNGQILWNSREIGAAESQRFRSRVIYLRQNPARFDCTVEAYFNLPYQLGVHLKKQRDDQQIDSYLKLADRTIDIRNRFLVDLSGGELQIVALIAVLQLNPDIILLDEPTSGLDPDTSRKIESIVSRWQRNEPDRAYLWVTHDLAQAKRVCQIHWTMEQGSIISQERVYG